MIPITWFILAWLVLLCIYGLLSFFSVVQMIRFSVGGIMAYFSTIMFLVVAFGVIALTVLYLNQTDLQAQLNTGDILHSSLTTQ